MHHVTFATAVLLAIVVVSPGAQSNKWSKAPATRGFFVVAEGKTMPLRVYAEPGNSGILRWVTGSFEEAPVLPRVDSFITNEVNWVPREIVVGSTAWFHDPRANRRTLRTRVMPISAIAREMKSVDLVEPTLTKLFEGVDAGPERGLAYVFFVAANEAGQSPRYFPIRIPPSSTQATRTDEPVNKTAVNSQIPTPNSQSTCFEAISLGVGS